MIFTSLYIDNLYNFYDTSLDLTLKRKIINSTIPFEYLEECPKFRFKRVCILSGANASGKTSLGRVLHYIQQFILYPNINLLNKVNDKEKKGIIRVEFVLPYTNSLHYLEIIQRKEHDSYPLITYAKIFIAKTDSASSARKKLMSYIEKKEHSKIKGYFYTNKNNPETPYSFSDIREVISKNLNYYYMFSDNYETNKSDVLIEENGHLSADILKTILTTFDPSISTVNEIRNEDGLEGYSIRFKNKDSVLINRTGDITNKERLSKGTFDAIQVTNFVSFIIEMTKLQKDMGEYSCGTYFLDEKMAYSHSELEQTIVNLIIQRMGRYSQFIYTTHNYDILDMNLPIHTFAFLKKEGDKAQFIQPEYQFKKNDRSLLNYVQNNVFNIIPDTSLLDELLFEE